MTTTAVPPLDPAQPTHPAAHPVDRIAPGRGYLPALGLATVGAAMANLVPAILTLSLKATVIDAANATTVLSVVVAVGSVFSLVAFPTLGRLSDRTRSRHGRRRPFLLLGALLLAAGGAVICLATTVPTLAVGNALTGVGFAAVVVSATASIADQLPAARRGLPSAVVGLSLPVGAVVGLFVAQLLSGSLTAMIAVPAAIGVLGALVLTAALRDRPAPVAARSRIGAGDVLRTFWVDPRKAPAFTLAFLSRFLLFLGVAAVQAYQAFYLILELHYTPADVAGAVFLSTLVLTGVALVVAPVSAKLSDRLRRRKPFVVVAAVVFATGLLLAAQASTFPAFLVAMGVVGLGQGVYMAVDIALVTEVLPDPENPAKDLGIMNLASTLPGTVVPVVAPFVLALGASAAHPSNFTALFLGGAVAAVLGALFILPIRQTR